MTTYYPPEDGEPERPWIGMALLLSVPLLSLILIRLLWSGSEFWFLLVGILFLGVSAALFLARRNDENGPTTLADEPNRLPLVLMGIGMVFVALLLLPNFSGGGSEAGSAPEAQQNPAASTGTPAAPSGAQPTSTRAQPTVVTPASVQPTTAPESEVAAPVPTDEPAAEEEEEASAPPEGSETYVVEDGDTLWAIADDYGVTVDEIVSANELESEDDIQVGDELAIPPSAAGESTD